MNLTLAVRRFGQDLKPVPSEHKKITYSYNNQVERKKVFFGYLEYYLIYSLLKSPKSFLFIFFNITFDPYFPLLALLKQDKRITLGSRLSNARFEVLFLVIVNNIIV
jgi:hypothetical protein